MTDSAPVRNTERTRRALLDAAGELLRTKGAGFSIADVAEHAGVSKSGLLHHFPSRDALLLAVLRDAHEQLREQVHANLDLSENVPGKLLRAYVRTMCSGESRVTDLVSGLSFWTGLEGVPGVDELDREDNQWWRENLELDGIDPTLARVVRRAAEGLAGALSYGGESAKEVHEAAEWLLRLTLREHVGE